MKIWFKDKIWEEYKLGLITAEEYQEKLAKHEEKLEKKRKYKKGKPITSLDEFIQQDIVFVLGKPFHRRWVANWQIGWIKHLMIKGYVCKAIKKENDND